MIVVDSSVLADALALNNARASAARDELARDHRWVAPDHVMIETLATIRNLVLRGQVSEQRGRGAVERLANLTIQLVRVGTLATRIWALRTQVTAQDAAYVAVAEAYGCPLLTADAWLSRASGLACTIRLVT